MQFSNCLHYDGFRQAVAAPDSGKPPRTSFPPQQPKVTNRTQASSKPTPTNPFTEQTVDNYPKEYNPFEWFSSHTNNICNYRIFVLYSCK